MRKLRIGQISPLNLPIPPKKYGGSERVIFNLCGGLKKRGHEVFLFGTGNSKVSCNLIPILKKGLWELEPQDSGAYYAYEMAIIARKIRELKIDIIHDHLGPPSLPINGQEEVPMIHTLHVPFLNKDRPWVYKKLNSMLVSISYAQRKPAKNLNYVANIYNGIKLEMFKFNPKPENQFIWLGELSPRKGILEVIRIAKKTNIRLVIVGRIPPSKQSNDYAFFQKYIKNELNKSKIEYVGEVEMSELSKYYEKAKAFLFPLQWEEPFGLVMAESMACGTPVIAFERGSVPEVIQDGKTGFVVKPFIGNKNNPNLDGFIEAIKKIDQIDRKKCRELVEKKFSAQKMVRDYERLYYRILKRR